jgi:hypothetical protein
MQRELGESSPRIFAFDAFGFFNCVWCRVMVGIWLVGSRRRNRVKGGAGVCARTLLSKEADSRMCLVWWEGVGKNSFVERQRIRWRKSDEERSRFLEGKSQHKDAGGRNGQSESNN